MKSLLIKWRERANALRLYADANSARRWDVAADELEATHAVEQEAPLSLIEAAERTGYTRDHLRSLIKRDRVPNVGTDYAPKIRVCDLPAHKPMRGPGRRARPPKVPTPEQVRTQALNTDP